MRIFLTTVRLIVVVGEDLVIVHPPGINLHAKVNGPVVSFTGPLLNGLTKMGYRCYTELEYKLVDDDPKHSLKY